MTTQEIMELRLETIYRLLAESEDGLTSGQISIRLGLEQSLVLRCLRKLEAREWVSRDRPIGAGVRWRI